MTYIVGLNYEGTSAIITDSVVISASNRHKIISDMSLKSGELVPGVIFAICGTVETARNFIIEAKIRLTGWGKLNEFWERFVSYAIQNIGKYSGADEFTLLLSERTTGEPKFHIYGSETGFKFNVDTPITLGSGKPLLDEYIYSKWKQKAHEGLCKKSNLPSLYFPYVYCLFLMECSQGYEVSELQNVGVGGYFNFSYQTNTGEFRQNPSAYVISVLDYRKRNIIGYTYRIGFAGPALVIQCPIKNEYGIIFDAMAWPKINLLSKTELNILHKQIEQEVENQPFYNFCGFGIADPELRGNVCVDYRSDENYLINKKGEHKPEFDKILKNIFGNRIT